MQTPLRPGRYESLARALREPERVVELALHSIPDEVYRLPNLEVLELHGARLESLPDRLAEIPKLRELNLANNQFTEVPQVLGRIPTLRSVNLAGNPFQDLKGIGALRSLTSLKLSNSPSDKLTLHPELFTLLGLEELNLHAFRYAEVPRELAQLTALRVLALSSGSFQDLPHELAALVRLERLMLPWGQLETVPAVLAEMPALRELLCGTPRNGTDVLSKLSLTGLWLSGGREQWAKSAGRLAETLTRLHLSGCELAHVPDFVCELRTLEKLDLSNNKLVTLPPAFATLSALRDLTLSKNLFTTLPDALAGLSGLRSLEINDCPLEQLSGHVLAKLTDLRSLSVWDSKNSLTTLPDELGTMSALEELTVRSHKGLTALPSDLSGLRSLVRLDVYGNGLTALPESIGTLTSLQTLEAPFNQLTSLPASIGSLTSLRSLNLSFNPLPIEIDDALRPLVHLRSLSLDSLGLPRLPDAVWSMKEMEELELTCLSFEAIASPLPAQLSDLTRLRKLKLGRGISALPSDLSTLVALEELSWTDANIEGFPEAICALRALRELRIWGAKLGPLPDSIGQLTQLESLYLGSCGVTAVPESLGAATGMRSLDLSANPIGRLPSSIGAMKELDVLDLKSCGLTTLPDSLGACVALRCLYLDKNPLGTLPDAFARLQALENLGLDETGLTELPKGLLALRNLSSLGLTGNEFPHAAMAALDAFAKLQRRGYLNVDRPRKGRDKKPRKPSSKPLSKKVLAQLTRLGAHVVDGRTPAEPVAVTIGGTKCMLPEALRQLVQDVTWPDGEFNGRLGALDLRVKQLRATISSGLLDEYECVKNDAYIELGHTRDYCLLLLKLSGNKAPDDPSVLYVDHDAFAQTEAEDYGTTLSSFLANLSRATN
jgi:Leucine-rich repeat (LRR) protein